MKKGMEGEVPPEYPELEEPCLSAIREERCLGCGKLEQAEFLGDTGCTLYEKKKVYSKDWRVPERS